MSRRSPILRRAGGGEGKPARLGRVRLQHARHGRRGFVAALRELPDCSEIPIVIVTIYEDKDFRYKALQAGATDFLLSRSTTRIPYPPAQPSAVARAPARGA